MKSCIITFHSANNYGAVLQAYALQEYLNESYGNTRILDYHNKNIDESYSCPQISHFFKKPKQAVYRLIQYILFIGKSKKIKTFRNTYFKLTKRYDESTVDAASDEADCFITGSDQVWNYLIIGNDSNYFLDFAQGKFKCSYAASFGISSIPDEYISFYDEYINKIDAISVREYSATNIIKGISDKKSYVHCDPTLLIDRVHWENMCIKPQNKKPYILVYKITKADKLLRFAKEVSRKTGLQIIYIPNDIKDGLVGKLKLSVGPQEWLGYILNAEYVITNSFHGTVFSIIFGKRFFSEVSDTVNPSTSRLLTLLNKFNLEKRIISKFEDSLLQEDLPKDIINECIKIERKETHDYFNKVFYGEDL